jgi:DNA polymerase-3 subunit gamma/tau
LLVEMTLVRAASLPPAKDIAGLIRKVEALEGGYSSGAVPRPTPPRSAPISEMVSSVPAEPVSAPMVEAAPVVSQPSVAAVAEESVPVVEEAPAASAPVEGAQPTWPQLVEQVRGRHPSLASVLEHGSLLSMQLPQLVLGFPASSFHLQQLKDEESKQRLVQLVRDVYGQELDLKIEALTDGKVVPPSLVEEEKKKESDRERRLRDDALTHPTVKKAIEIFSGEIESVTPIDKGFV